MSKFLFKFLFKFFGAWPLSMLYILAYVAAFILEKMDARIFQVIKVNIMRCGLNLNPRKILQESCKTGVEMLYFWACSREKLSQKIVRIHGLDAFNQAKKAGLGVLLLGPHLGAWEIINLYFSPIAALYDPLKLKPINDLMKEKRERFGSALFPADALGVKKVFRALSKGEVIGILPDQSPDLDSSGEFVAFLGQEALTISLPVRLVQKIQQTKNIKIPVFYVFAERKLGGIFEIYFIPVLPDFYNKDLKVALSAMNQGLENCIAICPEQYQFGYKRFKRRPLGQGSWY